MSVYKYKIEKKRIFTRNMPTIDTESITPDVDLFSTDPDIRRLKEKTIKDTPEHREFCFWVESECQSFAKIMAASIIGDGITVSCKNKKAVELIEKFNKQINITGQTIDDFIENTFIDGVIHGFFVWRIYPTDELEHGLDVSRIDPKTVVPITHSKKGYVKFIQQSYIIPDEPRSKDRFLSADYNPAIDLETKDYNKTGEIVYIHIPKEATISANLFQKPPISAAMMYIVFKRLILYYMRKSAEKYWIPLLHGKLGNKEHFPIISEEELGEKLDDLTQKLINVRNHSVIATPYYIDIQPIQIKRDVQNFVTELDYLNEEIIFSMLGSTGLIKAKGKDALATSRTIENVWLRIIRFMRAKYERELERFYKFLCKYNGIKDIDDLKIRWSSMKEDRNMEIVEMANMMLDRGTLKDTREYRDFVRQAFPWLEKLSDSEIKKLDKERKEKFERKYQMKGESTKPPSTPESAENLEFFDEYLKMKEKIKNGFKDT